MILSDDYDAVVIILDINLVLNSKKGDTTYFYQYLEPNTQIENLTMGVLANALMENFGVSKVLLF